MKERMKHITELVRNGFKLEIRVPTCILDSEAKRKAIEYLQNDDEIYFEYHPINDEDTLIEIEMKGSD